MLLGFAVMLVPFSGLPSSFRTVLTLIFGLTIVAYAVAMRMQSVRVEKGSHVTEPPKDTVAPPTAVSPI